MLEFVIIVAIVAGVTLGYKDIRGKLFKQLPTKAELKVEVDNEKLLIAGMQEVNRYLAPYQTPEDAWVDIGCQFCDAIRMDVTEQELDAEGWTYVNGSTRCPDCSGGEEKLIIKHFIGDKFVPLTGEHVLSKKADGCSICDSIRDCRCWPGDMG